MIQEDKILSQDGEAEIDTTITINKSQSGKTSSSNDLGLNYDTITTEEIKEYGVKRSLNGRQISFIALGGTIGTGLFVGIGLPLHNAGPVGSLLAFIFVGTIIYSVIQSLGEMVTFIPVTSSFTVFSQRFLSPAFGAANGYMYWFSWAMTFALELSIIGKIIEFWTLKVPLYVWIIVFWIILTTLNLFPVKLYGEIEFWIALIKIVAIVGFLIFALCMVCGASPIYGPIGFRYWKNPGPWGAGIISDDKSEARFLGFLSSLVNAAFTYQGTELIGITAGEAANPRKVVPKSVKKVVLRILVFYIFSLFFLGLLVPYDDPKLTSTDTYVASSPFIIAIQNSGVKILPDIFNGVILTTIISAANSNIYIGSRILYGLSINGLAPRILSRTTTFGIPYVSVLVTSLFGSFAFMELTSQGDNAFNWLLNIIGTAGFFAWLLISISHLRFMAALKYQGISRDNLIYKAVLMPYLAYYAIVCIIVIILIQGFTAFIPNFDVKNFFASYISLFLFLIIWLTIQLRRWCRIIWKVEDIDIDSDRRDLAEIVDDEKEPTNFWGKLWQILV